MEAGFTVVSAVEEGRKALVGAAGGLKVEEILIDGVGFAGAGVVNDSSTEVIVSVIAVAVVGGLV